MKQTFTQIQHALQNAPALLAGKKIAAGFDGFIDAVVKVVNYKTDADGTVFFRTISEFGSYISGKSGSGFSLESEEKVQKLGGNMPIMANALAGMGTAVDCVGAFGIPNIAPAFGGMHPKCNLNSFTNPGFTTAMEFTDGKMMLAQMTDLNNADWNTIKKAIGTEKLKEIFAGADLICLVNWSEPDHSNSMWQGLLDDVFADAPFAQKQFFFDLSDCSKRSTEAIATALKYITAFGNHGEVSLSLNRNEAGIIYKMLTANTPPADLRETGNQLFAILNIHTLVIHNAKISSAWDSNGVYTHEPVFIADPKISTGAGDNFNAGFCIGKLLGLGNGDCLMMANTTSNIYMHTGESPTIEALKAYFSR